jgi:dephospho-CoA kinase
MMFIEAVGARCLVPLQIHQGCPSEATFPKQGCGKDAYCVDRFCIDLVEGNMKIMIVVGMPASGKNIARRYAESKKIPYFATGDLVRNEVQRRGLDPAPENTGQVSTELRGGDGMGVTRLALDEALNSGNEFVFMEGMRSWPEIELIRKKAEGVLVAFIAPKRVRLERITFRGRSDDSPGGFEERDMREIAYGAAIPIALADEYVLNTGTVENSLKVIDKIVKKYFFRSGHSA